MGTKGPRLLRGPLPVLGGPGGAPLPAHPPPAEMRLARAQRATALLELGIRPMSSDAKNCRKCALTLRTKAIYEIRPEPRATYLELAAILDGSPGGQSRKAGAGRLRNRASAMRWC